MPGEIRALTSNSSFPSGIPHLPISTPSALCEACATQLWWHLLPISLLLLLGVSTSFPMQQMSFAQVGAAEGRQSHSISDRMRKGQGQVPFGNADILSPQKSGPAMGGGSQNLLQQL